MTANNKGKAPEKDLIWMMFFCFTLGLIPILFCLWVYQYWGDLQLTADDEFVPAFIYEHNLAVIRILVFGILPIMSFAFFYTGYKLWKYYRHYKTFPP
jgi:nitrate reductase NapE component